MKPFDTVSLKEKYKNTLSLKELSFEHFKIDFLNQQEVESLTITNCVIQSKGRCLKCDTLYTLDWTANVCARCDNVYLRFLDKYSQTTGSKVSANLSDKPLQEYSLENGNNTGVLTDKNIFTLLNVQEMTDEDSFYSSPLISTNLNTDKVIIYEKTIEYTYTRVPPIIYVFWRSHIEENSLSHASIIFPFQMSVNSQKKQFVVKRTLFDHSKLSFLEDYHNFEITYISKFADSASKNFELKSTSELNKILEIPKHELYLLIEQEKFNGMSIVPTSLNPGFDSDFVYEAYSPYFYLLHKQSDFLNSTKTAEPSIYISSFSSVKQLITCPLDCL